MKEISLEGLATLVRAYIESIGENITRLGSSDVFINKEGHKMIFYEDISMGHHKFYLLTYDGETIQIMQFKLTNSVTIPASDVDECIEICEKAGKDSITVKNVGDSDVVS